MKTLTALLLGLMLSACVSPAPAPLTIGGQVATPFAYVGFCVRQPAECGGGTDAPRLVSMTPAAFAELDEINRHVNALPQIDDVALYDRDEWWAYPGSAGGDCEDLVLEKRRLLIARGWPAEALLIAVVREWNGDGHAVLLVLTEAGRFVLDNKRDVIDRAGDAPYQWVKLQSPRRPFIWLSAQGGGQAVREPPLGEPPPFLAFLEQKRLQPPKP